MKNELLGIIKKEIEKNGPITFARYMEMALYFPGLGYYTSPGEKIGPAGDYYTSADVHPLFGRMLARQLAEMRALLGGGGHWQLVEYGAGKGVLVRDVLLALQEEHPDAWKGVTCLIIERSAQMIARQRETLAAAGIPSGKIRWVKNLAEAGGRLTGCIYANEVVDAFPVHRVRRTPEGLREIFVTWREGKPAEILCEPSTPMLAASLEEQGVVLQEGQTVEINLAAREWLIDVAAHLEAGFLLTIDYGGEAADLYHPARIDGTLRCFHRHRLTADPYSHPGEQDITASVNFSGLKHWGEEAGLKTAGFTTQMHFLLNLGILEAVRQPVEFVFDREKMRTTMAIKKLIMPEGMGRDFKVLCQYRGLAACPVLTGFQGRFKGPA